MPEFNLLRDLARKAAQALRRQLAQSENGLAALLNPGKRQAIPIPVPNVQRRAPRFPGDKRFYTQSTRGASRTGALYAAAKTEFGRATTRPRLTGTLRSHGYRQFSTSPCNHAHVAREVYAGISQGIRAGTLNIPYYPPPKRPQQPGSVFHATRQGLAASTSTVLRLPLTPAVVALRQGRVDELVSAVDEVLCVVPQYLARLRRQLSRLSHAGSFEYTLSADAIEVVFHGKDMSQVERFLGDIDVTGGTLTERPGLTADRHVDWRRVMQRPRRGKESVTSVERYLQAVDEARCADRARFAC